jgi:hypothetical protein
VERLADDISVEAAQVEDVECEYLLLRLASRGA